MANQSKKTVVLGASSNPERYSNLAINKLRANNHPVIAIGKKTARVADVEVQTDQPSANDVDTVTLYINAEHQKEYYDYILSLKPKRIIFNPGAENPELEQLAKDHQIKPMEACTLVLLSTGQF
ncbi:MAG: CoA-binding protein [Chitinophagaceae bacterium]